MRAASSAAVGGAAGADRSAPASVRCDMASRGLGPDAAEVDDHDAVAAVRRGLASALAGLARRRAGDLDRFTGQLLRRLLGGLALAHAALRLAVGEDLAEVA